MSRKKPIRSKRRTDASIARDDFKNWENLDSLPALAKGGPARAIVKLNPHRIVGGFDVPGLAIYPLEWESHLERISLLTVLMCHDVDAVATQPRQLNYLLDGIPRQYYPDLFIRGGLGDFYIEIKPLEILFEDENVDRYADVARRFREAGSKVFFLTDDQVYVKPRSETLELLKRYLCDPLSDTAVADARSATNHAPLSIGMLSEATGLDVREIYTLLAQRHLAMNWSDSLNLETKVGSPCETLPGLSLEAILNSGPFADLLAELSLGRRPTDQRKLARAKAVRQPIRQPARLSMVGGFPKRRGKHRQYEPLDQLGSDVAERVVHLRTAVSKPARGGYAK